jgi:hypothetical protein
MARMEIRASATTTGTTAPGTSTLARGLDGWGVGDEVVAKPDVEVEVEAEAEK